MNRLDFFIKIRLMLLFVFVLITLSIISLVYAGITGINTSQNPAYFYFILSLLLISSVVVFYLLLRCLKNNTASISEDKIKDSLKKKEIQLKEIHHRVKNNLQIISSLLYLQSQQLENKEMSELFKLSENRVKTMALIHEYLYKSENPDKINFEQYTNSIVIVLQESFNVDNSKIDIKVNVANIYLDIDIAIPCGLIMNELITNSIKHAFKNNNGNMIDIDMHIESSNFYLTIRDNGIGLPESLIINELKSLGLIVVDNLVKQINGELNFFNNSGSNFHIKFPVEG